MGRRRSQGFGILMPMARSRRARATENPCRGRENVMFSALGSLWLANSFFQAEPKAPRRENNAADLAPLTAIQQNSFTPKPAPSAKQAARARKGGEFPVPRPGGGPRQLGCPARAIAHARRRRSRRHQGSVDRVTSIFRLCRVYIPQSTGKAPVSALAEIALFQGGPER